MRRTIAAIGRTLLTLGLLILLFVAYQLWGTGIFTARAQSQLKKDFAKQQQAYAASVATTLPRTSTTNPVAPTSSTTTPKPLTLPPPPTPADGAVEGKITIPRIGLNMEFVEGTTRDDLKKGPGHYPETPIPGTIGNAAIAGHRTTYLHPFGDIDKLQLGDDILVQTLAGKFTYSVIPPDPEGHSSASPEGAHLIVKSTDVWVVNNTLFPEITLTACHPKGYAEHRIVVKAKLVPNKSATPAKPRPRKPTGGAAGKVKGQQTLSDGLSGQERSLTPAVGWGFAVAYFGLLWWWTFRRWRHPITWFAGVIPFLVLLFPFYVYLERALPAGY